MKNILIERSGKAFLPVVNAYLKYFNEKEESFRLYDSSLLTDWKTEDFDMVWRFMGIDAFQKLTIPVIHEYPSLSTGMFPKLKNKIKQTVNRKPELRVFLNRSVKEGMNFKDQIEYIYRDMGVDDIFFGVDHSEKKFDCVYVGSMSKERDIHLLLDYFKWKGKNLTLLLIGDVSDEIYGDYRMCENITFTGKLKYEDVPECAAQAVYGMNFMPDKYPYNIQTSTKLLEYLSMGLKVITTDYLWVRNFMDENKIQLVTVNHSLDGLDSLIKKDKARSIDRAHFEKYKWSHIIQQSGIEEKIIKLL